VSGYLTEDGRFFQEKKEAEAHEKLLGVNKMIDSFVHIKYVKTDDIVETLQSWERYKMEMSK
jgi:dsDNA-binding SOS-regulon protein